MKKIYRKTIHDTVWKEIPTSVVGCWEFYVDPTENEFADIAAASGFPLESIQTSFDPFDLPRVEQEGNSVLLVFRLPARFGALPVHRSRFLPRWMNSIQTPEWQFLGDALPEADMTVMNTTEPLVFIITGTNIISIVKRERPFTNRLLQDTTITSTQKTNFLLRVLLHCMARYRTALGEVNRQILNNKASIARLGDEDILSLVEIEEMLTNFNSALVPLIGILEKISLGKIVPLFERDKDILEELTVSGREILDWCSVNIHSASNIREAHSTILTNRLNRTITFLTSMTILVTIPNIIAGMFGMNVVLPLQENPHAFFLIISIMVVCVGAALVIFWRKRWL